MASVECCYSAPGKVILFGEHWVVHGGWALAAAIGLRAYACVSSSKGSSVIVCSREMGTCEDVMHNCKVMCNIRYGLSKLREICSLRPGLRIEVRSELPPGAGLGSSAAVATAVMASVVCAVGCPWRLENVWDAAFEAEKYVHGNPSGIDNTVALYGGLLLYNRFEGVKRLELRVPESVKLVVVDSGVSRSTRRAVEIFTQNLRRLGGLGRRLLDLANSITFEAVECMRRGDYECVGRLMNVAHGLLSGMGVSLPILEEIVAVLRRHGALGAKLTGAGLGGVVIGLFEESVPERVVEQLRARGFNVWAVELGAEGLRSEMVFNE